MTVGGPPNDWLNVLARNKAPLGKILLVLGGIMQGGSPTMLRWSALALCVGGILTGGGGLEADASVRIRQARREAGLPDRRRRP